MTIFLSVLAALIVFFYFPPVLRLLWALRYVFLALALIVAGARSRDTLYRVTLDGEELPVNWPDARKLEAAIRTLIFCLP